MDAAAVRARLPRRQQREREGSIEKHTSHATAHPDQKLLYSPREAMTLEERKAARKASLNSWPSEPTTEFPGKEFGDGRGHSRASSAHALAEALRKDAGLPPGPPRRRRAAAAAARDLHCFSVVLGAGELCCSTCRIPDGRRGKVQVKNRFTGGTLCRQQLTRFRSSIALRPAFAPGN